MCGIFGLNRNSKYITEELSKKICESLFLLSESRGKDASGLACITPTSLYIYKAPIPAHKIIKTKTFSDIINIKTQFLIGHARMETNGSFENSNNNQPVVSDGIATIHNGIIVNDTKLWSDNPQIKRLYDVDTEIINALLSDELQKGADLPNALINTTTKLKGSYSICSLFKSFDAVSFATNTGSLYFMEDSESKEIVLFASERFFVESVQERHFSEMPSFKVRQLKPGFGLVLNVSTNEYIEFSLSSNNTNVTLNLHKSDKEIIGFAYPHRSLKKTSPSVNLEEIIKDEYERNREAVSHLKRCTKCLLPETMPFIEFDKDGVCNYCQHYTKHVYKGKESLLEALGANHGSKNDKPNCVLAFSGGRDSSYALYYVKEVLKMNPVAFSYDWGMLTDLGRRNQARMTGALGVEHILISADIKKKRENIRQNVEAWLKRPSLGTVPLFMAGDKQYFYYAKLLKNQLNIGPLILCENFLEKTDFKSGFSGVKPHGAHGKNTKFYSLSALNLFKMAFFYAKENVLNPSYINNSIIDSLHAFYCYYIISHDFISIYDYIEWNEAEVEKVLDSYDWERAEDTNTTWRIGDGTAAFYNYIYYTIAGFSENDTFRSNQIRENALSREEALNIVQKDSEPRLESMKWYTDTIGIDLSEAIKIINAVPKLYKI